MGVERGAIAVVSPFLASFFAELNITTEIENLLKIVNATSKLVELAFTCWLAFSIVKSFVVLLSFSPCLCFQPFGYGVN